MKMSFFIIFLVLIINVSSIEWRDWDGMQTCNPIGIVTVNSEEEIISHVKNAYINGGGVKVVGAGHSFSSITLTDDNYKESIILILEGHEGLVNVDKENNLVEVKSGTHLWKLNELLEAEGLALLNLGATSAQTIAGATSTGTHGTGRNLGSLSTQIEKIRIIDGKGNIIEANKNNNPELFIAARIGLGYLGVISTLTLKIRPIYKMKLTSFDIGLDEILEKHEFYYQKYERFQWSFTPFTNSANIMIREETDEEITEGGCWGNYKGDSCVDLSYKTLTDYPPTDAKQRQKYTEMEMFISVKDLIPALKEFINFQNSVKDHHVTTTELTTLIRYIKSDDILLSPMHNRDSAVISMIVAGDRVKTGDPNEFSLLARGLEKITSESYNGAPHWGKQNYANKKQLQNFYGKNLEIFEVLRKKYDPNGVFINDYYRERFYDNKKNLQ